MHNNGINPALAVAGKVDQFLKLWPFVIGSRCARLYKLGNDAAFPCSTPSLDLSTLVGDREVGLSLATSRDTQINNCVPMCRSVLQQPSVLIFHSFLVPLGGFVA
jgi:hypothetical protein